MMVTGLNVIEAIVEQEEAARKARKQFLAQKRRILSAKVKEYIAEGIDPEIAKVLANAMWNCGEIEACGFVEA